MLEGTLIERVLERQVYPVRPEVTLSALVSEYILAYHQHCYPVMEGGALVGLITPADLKKFPRTQWEERTVSEAMTPRERLHSVRTADDLAKVAEQMAGADVHQLPVMDGGRFLGFVTRADIVRLVQVRGSWACRRRPGAVKRRRRPSP
ncbi:MAG: CBS domain-containing protein [Chloroflexi bacterium]|nr:CBS domain-containing protein [Chloroflexota bacterium]